MQYFVNFKDTKMLDDNFENVKIRRFLYKLFKPEYWNNFVHAKIPHGSKKSRHIIHLGFIPMCIGTPCTKQFTEEYLEFNLKNCTVQGTPKSLVIKRFDFQF